MNETGMAVSSQEGGQRYWMKVGAMMNVIYSSDNYYVVEYPAQHGYELVDKRSQRGTFFQGDVAERFAQSLKDAVAEEPSVERVDEFLGGFDILLNQPLAMH